MGYIDFSAAPEDPIARLAWLSGMDKALRAELEAEWAEAYFNARLQGMFDEAVALRLHSKKRILAWTRRVNDARGRAIVRWGDGN